MDENSLDVVLVDDHEPLLKVLALLAKQHGLNPIPFTSGNKAMEYLSGRSTPLKGALVDMRLPDELDSSEQIYNLKRQFHCVYDQWVN